MRIHFFVRSLNLQSGGGSNYNATSYIRYLQSRGHTVVVHSFTSGNNKPPADISITEHDGQGNGFVSSQHVLCALLQKYENDADLYFLYGVDFTWGGGRYRAQGGSVPTVVYLDDYLESLGLTTEGGFLYHFKRVVWDKMFGLRLAKRVDMYMAVSPFVQDAYVQFGFPQSKFVVVPNFFESKTQHEKSVHNNTDVVRLLYTGRLVYDKGVDLLVQAVAQLPKNLQWHVRIVGSGDQKVLCEQLIQKYNLQDNIDMVAWMSRQDVQKEYESADIFVHPVRWPEPFGRTIVEAMQHGLAVIVPQKGGASWVAGEAGITFINGSVGLLGAAIERLITDPALRQGLGQKGIQRAAQFEVGTIGPQFEKHLLELVSYKSITNEV